MSSADATPSTPAKLRIDFVSDVSCPWCAVGLKSLETALQRLDGVVDVDLHFQPFELNPQMAAGGESIAEHLQKKYGSTPEQTAANRERIRQRGAELGFEFRMDLRDRIYNTFDAHRLLHWAEGEGRQKALKERLLRAYFSEGADVSDHAVLAQLAGDAGLDAARAQAILASDEFAAETRAAEKFFVDHGIHAVPAIIIERQHLISGGQPVEIFERALREIAGK